MITSRDEKNFKDEVRDEMPNVLDMAIEFLKSNAQPDDVFSDSQLEYWAESNGYIKDPEA